MGATGDRVQNQRSHEPGEERQHTDQHERAHDENPALELHAGIDGFVPRLR